MEDLFNKVIVSVIFLFTWAIVGIMFVWAVRDGSIFFSIFTGILFVGYASYAVALILIFIKEEIEK